MTNSNVVWSADKGWHDGPPATTTVQDGRLVIELLAQLERDRAAWHNRGRSVIIDASKGDAS